MLFYSIICSQVEELNSELDLRLHLHEPRAARAEQDVHNVRAGRELTLLQGRQEWSRADLHDLNVFYFAGIRIREDLAKIQSVSEAVNDLINALGVY